MEKIDLDHSLLHDIAYMNEQVILLLPLSCLVFLLGAFNCILESIGRLYFPPSQLPGTAEKMALHVTTHYTFIECGSHMSKGPQFYVRCHAYHKPVSSYSALI